MPFDGYDSLADLFDEEDFFPFDDSHEDETRELAEQRDHSYDSLNEMLDERGLKPMQDVKSYRDEPADVEYDSLSDMFSDQEFQPIDTWEEREVPDEGYRPETLGEKVGTAFSRGWAESKAQFLNFRKLVGEAPANQLLDIMHTMGAISDEDHARITSSEDEMQAYRNRFDAALGRHPVT